MSHIFRRSLLRPCSSLISLKTVSNHQLTRWSRYHYQMQAENARKLLIRKDGREMTTHEIQSLFKNIGQILEEVSKDPKGFEPSDLDGTEELMDSLREVRLEYAPDQLQYLSSNFMIWFHGYKGKRVYADLHRISSEYDLNSSKKENEFNSFSQRLLTWSGLQSADMQIVWDLLDGIDAAVLMKEMEIEDEEEMLKMLRNLRINCSLYLEDYNRYLLRSYDDIMAFSQSITFLEYEEAQLALTASPFLGKFDVLHSLMDRLTQEKGAKSPEILVQKHLDLPTGLDWFNLYKMYGANSKYKGIITEWENFKDLSSSDFKVKFLKIFFGQNFCKKICYIFP